MIAYANPGAWAGSAVPSAPVVVGADGSGPALRAVAWAAEEAALRHRRLEIVHVTDTGRADVAAGIVDRARTVAAGMGRRLERDLPITTVVTCASPPDELTWFSGRADVLVVGYRGTGRLLAAGSTARAVARTSVSPVVVVRATPGRPVPDRFRPVVVGVDESPDSAGAVRFAADVATRRGCPLVAVHVCTEHALVDAVRGARGRDHQPRGAGDRLLAECLAGIGENHPGLEVRREVIRERVVPALLDRSSTAQLLVVGRRGRGRLAALALGSTSDALVRQSACPVAVVRGAPAVPRRPALAAAASNHT